MSSARFKNKKHSNNNYASTTSFRQFGIPSSDIRLAPSNIDRIFEEALIQDEIQHRFGFDRYEDGPERLGWLLNMNQTLVRDSEWPGGRSAVDFYFRDDNGETFKATKTYSPYFFIGCKPGTESEVEDYLNRRFEGLIEKFKQVKKEDLKQPNHLVGHVRVFIQLSFRNHRDMINVRKVLLPIFQKNKSKRDAVDTYSEILNATNKFHNSTHSTSNPIRRNPDETLENLIDIREHDIPFHIRMAIDLDIRVGLWYTVKAQDDNTIDLMRREDLVHRPEPVVLAFDIETTKLPLKFPDVAIDQIMMISYMIDGQGYLITNREIVSQDIEDFEYTPKPDYEGPFIIFNEENEEAVLRRFFDHIQRAKPNIFVTYNGDFFDWPFVEGRSKVHAIDMYHEIGVYKDEEDEYKCKHASHMDAFRWVQRDSYLPNGSQGLKAVTTAKLGYNPLELDPEDMTRFANEQPQVLAQYSVSDAVATYYLYMKYVHPFIYSLCNIIPMVPDEVLRKGTGTLCEQLLMVEAYKVNVIIPNKHVEDIYSFYEGHLLESETYVGGHVEALEAGVFRSDINSDFKLDPSAAQELIDQLDHALKFTIEVEENKKMEDIANYEEVKQAIVEKLEALRDKPIRQEPPLIYHLDVAAMYPNIILTNRLQPDAMIDEAMCATCDFNTPDKNCDRRMKWLWRGEYIPTSRSDYRMIENLLSNEMFPPKYANGQKRTWHSLEEKEKADLMRSRLKDYSRKVHSKVKETKVMERESIICQRENPFYIETVRAFRDRRYEYKGLHKTWKGKLDDAVKDGSVAKVGEAKNMIVLFDSLQLAHKCILNSFYGYVMRPGARWRSLEMAGIVCLTGSNIIQMARKLVERLGRPLELDTDGIWCILPKSFPETFNFTLKNGKSLRIYYPCTMLNHLVHAQYTNHQYQHLKDPKTFEYSVSKENSIFFEIDGPYRAMILPSSTEEDKLLKKRYAVFDMDGSLAELKGFEVKRRGELKLIKIFQTEIFSIFLQGKTLVECYGAVAEVADRWLDVLFSKARHISDDDLFELITENRSMSKALAEYGSQKSTPITTAKRLSEFLGDQMVKDKGLACSFIVSSRPFGLPVSERAIPVAIFQSEESVKKHYLRKWLGDNSLTTFDIRDILDWDYYIDRFGSVIQKIITIPAAMQNVSNPVPRIRHPDWLFKRVSEKNLSKRQYQITDMFSKIEKPAHEDNMEIDDIEELDVSLTGASTILPKIARVTKKRRFSDNPETIIQSKRLKELGFNIPLPKQVIPENMPDEQEDYVGWFEHQKQKWKRNILVRAHNREKLGSSISAKGPTNGVGNYFRNQNSSLVSGLWEVIQITETDIPGECKLWVMVQDQMHSVRLTIPRTFYVNCREDVYSIIQDQNPAYEVERCSRTLPRSYATLDLFQITMPESDFQAELAKSSNIFNHPSIDTTFETSMSLLVRAVLNLGSVCQFKKKNGSAVRRNNDQFNLSELKSKTDQASNYMNNPKAFHYVYLFHGHSDNRHLFALVGAALPISQIFVVGLNKHNQQIPNIERVYKEIYEETRQGSPLSDTVQVPETMGFESSYHSNESDAMKAVNKALLKYQDTKKGKTVLVVNSPRSSTYLIQHARMISEFPYLRLPTAQEDRKFEALNWAQPMLKRLFKYYMGLGTLIDEKMTQARYANVPFCNIPEDTYVFMSDVLFARAMIKNDMVIWWSNEKLPDLGGMEEDESVSITDELVNPELSFQGAYETVCADFDISRLCLNTLLISPIINELEGTAGTGGFDNASNFDNDMVSGKTLNILRSIVLLWINGHSSRDKKIGGYLADTFQRWLMSSDSSMYDPGLYNLIHSLMKKVFMQLVSELKRLGAKVVFANFHRILVTATKETAESGMSYFEYLHRTLDRKQLFEYLVMKNRNYWDVLLWMDEWNFSGVLVGNYVNGVPAITKQWSIEEHLPTDMRAKFVHFTSLYLYTMTQNKRNHPRGITVQNSKTDEPANDDRSINLRDYIQSDLARKMSRWLTKYTSDRSASQINHAVEFIKHVCGVIELDSRVEDAVLVLKRSLLRQTADLSDFSKRALFKNPIETYKLVDVCCLNCNYITDFDFRRDPSLVPENGQVKIWRCKECSSEYNKTVIERLLIAKVQEWLTLYQQQDFVCGRCHMIKVENLARYCSRCSGDFVCTRDKADLQKRFKVIKTIAVEQQTPLLEEFIDYCSRLIN